jgi:hypothetical protein
MLLSYEEMNESETNTGDSACQFFFVGGGVNVVAVNIVGWNVFN